MSKNGAEKPTFDFTRVSKEWNHQFALSLTAVTKAEITLKRPQPKTDDYDVLTEFYDKQEEALTVIERLAGEQAGMVAQVLVDVPRDWLLETAPDAIDWGDPASLNFVQADRYGEMLEMIRNGEARSKAKN